MNQVILIRDLVGSEIERINLPSGLTIAEIVGATIKHHFMPEGLFEAHGGVFHRGRLVSRDEWPTVAPEPGEYLHLVIRPADGKGVLTIVASVALLAATAGIASAGIPFLGIAAGSIGAKLASAAIGVLGSMALQKVFAPEQSSARVPDSTPANVAGVEGNLLTPNGRMQRPIGLVKIAPLLVTQPLIEVIGKDVYAEAVYALAGPVAWDRLDLEGVNLSEAPDIEYQVRSGLPGDPPLTLVSRYGFVSSPNAALSAHKVDPDNSVELLDQNNPTTGVPTWHRFESHGEADEVWVVFSWPGGLGSQRNSSVDRLSPLRIRIRPSGTISWFNLPEVHYRSSKIAALRKMFKLIWGSPPSPLPTWKNNNAFFKAWRQVPVSAAGGSVGGWTAHADFASGAGLQDVARVSLYEDRVEFFLGVATFPKGPYEIEVIQGESINPDDLNNSYVYTGVGWGIVTDLFGYQDPFGTFVTMIERETEANDLVIELIESIVNSTPVPRLGEDGILVVRAKNRRVQQVTATAWGLVPDYDPVVEDWIGMVQTRNPAPHLRYVLNDLAMNSDPLPVDVLDEAAFVPWRQFCDDESLEVSLIAQNDTALSIAALIAVAGRAGLKTSHNFGVIWEHDRSEEGVVGVITPRNSANYRFEKAFDELPGGYLVSFANEDKDWQHDQVAIYDDPPFDMSPLEAISLPSVSNPDQVPVSVLVDLRSRRLRGTIHMVDMDIEAITFDKGDLVGFSHDVLLRHTGWARVKEILQDTGDDVIGVVLDAEVPIGGADTMWVSDTMWVQDDFWLMGATSAGLRLTDNTQLVKSVLGPEGDTTTIYFETPFELPVKLKRGCLVVTGPTGLLYERMIVAAKATGRDHFVTVSMVAEAQGIHG